MDETAEIVFCIVIPCVVFGIVIILVGIFLIVNYGCKKSYEKTRKKIAKKSSNADWCIDEVCSLGMLLHLLGCIGFFLEFAGLVYLVADWFTMPITIILCVISFIAIALVFLLNVPVFGYFFGMFIELTCERLWKSQSESIKLLNVSIYSFLYFAGGIIDGGIFVMEVEANPTLGDSRRWWFAVAIVLLLGGLIGFFAFFLFCITDSIWKCVNFSAKQEKVFILVLIFVLFAYIILDIVSLVACTVFSFMSGVQFDSICLLLLLVIDIPCRLVEFAIAFYEDRKENDDLFFC